MADYVDFKDEDGTTLVRVQRGQNVSQGNTYYSVDMDGYATVGQVTVDGKIHWSNRNVIPPLNPKEVKSKLQSIIDKEVNKLNES